MPFPLGSVGSGPALGRLVGQDSANNSVNQQGNRPGLRESIGAALSRIAHTIGDGFQRITHSGRYNSDAVFVRNNPYVTALANPPRGQPGMYDDGILARHGDKIMEKLIAYRDLCGSKISNEEMRALINTGEHLVNALNHGQVNDRGDTIRVTVNGTTYDVKSCLHTTRAISWYLTAKAAELELLEGGDHLVREGTMIMQDPGNRLFRYLSAAPTAYDRISTHFNERHDGPTPRGLFTNQPTQRGIEDFQGKLPSKRGALCFDRLKGRDGSPQLFMKFESVGMPTVFRLSGHGEDHESGLRKVANVFRSIGHCIKHALNFITTRFDRAHGTEHVHKEHVVKGEPKNVVWKPFTELLRKLDTSTPEARRCVDELLANGKKHGISYIEEALENIGQFVARNNLTPKPGFYNEARELLENIKKYHQEQGPDFGVERKGKETHISLETYPPSLIDIKRNENGQVELQMWYTIPLN